MDSRYIYDDGPDNPPTASIPGPLFLAARTYQLSPLEVRRLHCASLFFLKNVYTNTYEVNILKSEISKDH